MKQPFTEDLLTEALQSLKADASDELFEELTQETRKPHIVPLRRIAIAAALVGLLAGVGFLLWQYKSASPAPLREQKEVAQVAPINQETTDSIQTETPNVTRPTALQSNKKKRKRPVKKEPIPSNPASSDEDLSQLIAQASEDLSQAEERREEISDIIDQYIAFVEP